MEKKSVPMCLVCFSTTRTPLFKLTHQEEGKPDEHWLQCVPCTHRQLDRAKALLLSKGVSGKDARQMVAKDRRALEEFLRANQPSSS